MAYLRVTAKRPNFNRIAPNQCPIPLNSRDIDIVLVRIIIKINTGVDMDKHNNSEAIAKQLIGYSEYQQPHIFELMDRLQGLLNYMAQINTAFETQINFALN